MRETNIQSIEKRVYELETNGGGGGTSNYEQLTNRPKIEGKTLSGNMTFEDLGIASAVDLAQTDGDLQDLADKFSPIYATDESVTLDVALHSVITNERIPENERRTFTVKCDTGWFICDIQRSTDKYVGTALAQSSNDRYTVRGTIGGASTEISPFSAGGGSITFEFVADVKAKTLTFNIDLSKDSTYLLIVHGYQNAYKEYIFSYSSISGLEINPLDPGAPSDNAFNISLSGNVITATTTYQPDYSFRAYKLNVE